MHTFCYNRSMDEHLRSLLRRWQSSGDPDDKRRYTKAAIRAGALMCEEKYPVTNTKPFPNPCVLLAKRICRICGLGICDMCAMEHMPSQTSKKRPESTRYCIVCGEHNQVCCDEGYDCQTFHIEPVCTNCCPEHSTP